MSARDLRDEFRKDPSLSILLSDDVFRKLVRKGIEEGVYIYQREGLLAGQGDPMPTIHIDEQAMIFTIDFAKNKGLWPRQRVAAPPGGPAGGGSPMFPPPDIVTGGAPPSSPGGFQEPPPAIPVPVTNAHSFKADGVLKDALRQVFEQARAKKLDKVDKVTIRLFDAGDAFKLVPVVAQVPGAKRTVEMEGAYQTAEQSTMEFKFTGTPSDASTIKSYLEPQFRAATENNLNTALMFDFEGGLALSGDAADKFIERLTRFASAAAHVEATAEVL
jgi:hypothetical protein